MSVEAIPVCEVTTAHDWRLLDEAPILARTDGLHHGPPKSIAETGTRRRWYCTRCRRIEILVEPIASSGSQGGDQ